MFQYNDVPDSLVHQSQEVHEGLMDAMSIIANFPYIKNSAAAQEAIRDLNIIADAPPLRPSAVASVIIDEDGGTAELFEQWSVQFESGDYAATDFQTMEEAQEYALEIFTLVTKNPHNQNPARFRPKHLVRRLVTDPSPWVRFEE